MSLSGKDTRPDRSKAADTTGFEVHIIPSPITTSRASCLIWKELLNLTNGRIDQYCALR
jgi:hypothetical protein